MRQAVDHGVDTQTKNAREQERVPDELIANQRKKVQNGRRATYEEENQLQEEKLHGIERRKLPRE